MIEQNMAGQTEHLSQDSKQTLLKGAEELFAKHGFDGISIRLIATELGVNSVMISYYLGYKEALYLQIFRNRLLEIADEISRFEGLDLDLGKKLEGYLLVYIKRISSNQSFHRMLYNHLATQLHQAVISMVSEAHVQIYHFLLKIVKSGIHTGHLKTIDEKIFSLNILPSIPSVFTETLASLVHFNEPIREDITGRIIDYIMLTVIPEQHQLQKSVNV